jgi:hypothetical protein
LKNEILTRVGKQAIAGRTRAGALATAGTPETLQTLTAEEGTSTAEGMAATLFSSVADP